MKKYYLIFVILIISTLTLPFILASVKNQKEVIIEPKTQILKNIIKYLYMPKDKILKKLGNRYKIVETGAEGVLIGYYYNSLGITFTFDDKDKNVAWIDCDPKVNINGARAGMNFAQIQKFLGVVSINESWIDTPDNKVYEIRYKIGRSIVYFQSYFKDGKNSKVFIFPFSN